MARSYKTIAFTRTSATGAGRRPACSMHHTGAVDPYTRAKIPNNSPLGFCAVSAVNPSA
jgi:hypothetical protein